MVRNVMLPILSVAMALACLPIASGATLTGIVTDGSGKPLEDARIEHIGKMVVVYPTALALEIRQGKDAFRRFLLSIFRHERRAPSTVTLLWRRERVE